MADHMVLTPDGIDFAPYPDAGRDRPRKVRHPAHRDLLRAPAHRLRGLLPGRLALQAPRRPQQAQRHPGRHRGRREGEPEIPAHGLADPARHRTRSAPSSNCRRCGAPCPLPRRANRRAARKMRRDARFRGENSRRTPRCSLPRRWWRTCPPQSAAAAELEAAAVRRAPA